MFALNLAIVVVGAGVLGGAVVNELMPSRSGGAPNATASERSAAIAIEFSSPRFGDTFANGRDANGRVTGMRVEAEIWLLVGPKDSAALTPQGPCTTNGATWSCVNVLLGPPGTYVLIVVVAPPDVVATLRDAREVRAVPPGALISTQVVVYG